jgi:hypothetical protein
MQTPCPGRDPPRIDLLSVLSWSSSASSCWNPNDPQVHLFPSRRPWKKTYVISTAHSGRYLRNQCSVNVHPRASPHLHMTTLVTMLLTQTDATGNQPSGFRLQGTLVPLIPKTRKRAYVPWILPLLLIHVTTRMTTCYFQLACHISWIQGFQRKAPRLLVHVTLSCGRGILLWALRFLRFEESRCNSNLSPLESTKYTWPRSTVLDVEKFDGLDDSLRIDDSRFRGS